MKLNGYLKVRIVPEARELLKQGADEVGETLSGFVRRAAMNRARGILARKARQTNAQRRHKAAVALVGLMALLASCSDGATTGVLVNVEAPEGLGSVEQLRATFVAGTMADVKLFPPTATSAPLGFPTAFSVTLPVDGARETLDIVVEGMAARSVVAYGTNRVMAKSGGFAEVAIRLAEGENPCGNGDLDRGEECDDHNRVGGDGCDPICRREPGTDGGAMDLGSDGADDGGAPDSAGTDVGERKGKCRVGGWECTSNADCGRCSTDIERQCHPETSLQDCGGPGACEKNGPRCSGDYDCGFCSNISTKPCTLTANVCLPGTCINTGWGHCVFEGECYPGICDF